MRKDIISKIVNFLKYFLIFLFSILLAPFFYGEILIKKVLKKKSRILKILVIQTARIGDMVCTTPVFREIKKHYPKARLVVLSTSKTEGIIKNNKNIDEIIIYNLNHFQGIGETLRLIAKIRNYHFDISISMLPGTLNYLIPLFSAIPKRIATLLPGQSAHYYIFSIFNTHTLKYQVNTLLLRHYLDLLQFIGIKDYSLKKEVFPNLDSLRKAEVFFLENNILKEDLAVGINPTANNRFKQWDHKKFAKLADLIIKKYRAKVILIGGPQDKDVIMNVASAMEEIPVITFDKFTLSELPGLLKKLKVYVSVDSGPLYIANALDIPVVDIIGPVSCDDQPPVYEKCEAVHIENLYCWPCSYAGKTKTFCKEGHSRCMKDLIVSDVFEAFGKIISRY